jgi:hypothetical protein
LKVFLVTDGPGRLRKRREEEDDSTSLRWPVGAFYVPGFSSDRRIARVPGAADTHRRFFLVRAAKLEPDLLPTLRAINESASAIKAWAARWHLTDRWCVLLAEDTKRWWSNNPGFGGWQFEHLSIAVGHFPFRIEPLRLKPFYYDPTWRRRRDFQQHVLEQVRGAVRHYCDRVESDALAAGLKRAPRKAEDQHFDWLVRYQIKGESFAAIARTAGYNFSGGRQTIQLCASSSAKSCYGHTGE